MSTRKSFKTIINGAKKSGFFIKIFDEMFHKEKNQTQEKAIRCFQKKEVLAIVNNWNMKTI